MPSAVRFTIAAVAIAATASFAVTLGRLPVWALFAGLPLAIAAQAATGLLSPFAGPRAIPITVFAAPWERWSASG
ncbi:hypothetical protein ABZX92_44130 [Lentzea sp. NPDC006480]|uniref:hypothetical protein n=1 Tax=Lentzea sp. NPDC006480 TaxID=3157176 RepID=UPI0033B14C47